MQRHTPRLDLDLSCQNTQFLALCNNNIDVKPMFVLYDWLLPAWCSYPHVGVCRPLRGNHPNTHTNKQTTNQTNKQTNKQINKQTDRQTYNKQSNKQLNKQTNFVCFPNHKGYLKVTQLNITMFLSMKFFEVHWEKNVRICHHFFFRQEINQYLIYSK